MAPNRFPCTGTDDHSCPGDALGYRCYGSRYLCRNCEFELGFNRNGAPVGKVINRDDDPVFVNGLQVVSGSTLLAQQLTDACDVFCREYVFDEEGLANALQRLLDTSAKPSFGPRFGQIYTQLP